MPRIRRIQIKNFRSFKSLDIDIDDLTTFVGDNDSGKSNILRALNIFFNDSVEPNDPLNFERDYNKFAATNQRARGVCQTSCPPISCGVSDFKLASFAFRVQPDGSGGLPVARLS